MCLWGACAGVVLGQAGPVAAQAADDAAPLTGGEGLPEVETEAAGGAVPPTDIPAPDVPDPDAPGVPDAELPSPPDVLPAVDEEPPAPEPAADEEPRMGGQAVRAVLDPAEEAADAVEPVPAQPAQPIQPAQPALGSIPLESAPAIAPQAPPVHIAPPVAPAPRIAERAATVVVSPSPPASELGVDARPPARTAPTFTPAEGADVDTAASTSPPPERRSVRSAATPERPPGPAVAPPTGLTALTSMRSLTVVGRSAPGPGGPPLDRRGKLAEEALTSIAATDVRPSAKSATRDSLTATVSLPGGTAPADSPLERIADYLMYGGTTAAGPPPILVAVVAPAPNPPSAPSAGDGRLVCHDAGAPRPAHAHPRSRPG